MLVILIKSVKKLGAVGSVISVKGGFGRNYLIPNGYAIRATEKNKIWLENEKITLEQKNIEAKNLAVLLKEELDGKDFTIINASSSEGRLFGTISARAISRILNGHGYNIHYNQIKLHDPIRNIGVFGVQIDLHFDVNCKVLINVAKSQSEAFESVNRFKSATTTTVTNTEGA